MIKIAEVCGESLNTRFYGASLKDYIMKRYSSRNKIILDFSNVKSMSQSFADQCFGMIVAEIGLNSFQKNFKIINIKADVGKMIKYVALKRAKKINNKSKNQKSHAAMA
jgi:hypothetical protein